MRFSLDRYLKLDYLRNDAFLSNSGYLFGVLIASAALGFVCWSITTRIYDQESVGQVTAIISLIQLVAGFANLGFGMGVIRFLAGSSDKTRLINTVINATTIASLLTGIVCLISLPISSPSLVFIIKRWDYCIIFLMMIATVSLNSLLQMIFQACRESKYAFFVTLISNVLRILLTIYFLPIGWIGILLAIMISSLIGLFVGSFVYLPKLISEYQYKFSLSLSNLIKLFPFSFGNYLSGFFVQIPMLISPIIVINTLGSVSSGKSYLAWMLASLIISPGQALAGSAFTEGSFSPGNFQPIVRRAIKISLSVTLALAIFTVLFSPMIFFFFGKNYQEGSVGLLIWLALASPIVALNKILFSVLQIQQKIQKLLVVTALSAILFIITASALVNNWQLHAIGFGWLISQLAIITSSKGQLAGRASVQL